MKIIVGLGNPDKKYQGTRHNVGYQAVDELAASAGLTWRREKTFKALVAKGDNYFLVKPLTYMNQSGEAVQKILNYYHLTPADLIVIHDDLDLPLGKYKFASGATSAGHHGIESIIKQLQSKNFNRLRLGLATPVLDRARKSIFPGAVARFVLKKFTKEEQPLINQVIAEALKAI